MKSLFRPLDSRQFVLRDTAECDSLVESGKAERIVPGYVAPFYRERKLSPKPDVSYETRELKPKPRARRGRPRKAAVT